MAFLDVRVTTRASRADVGDGRTLPVPVRVCSAPAEGEANRAVIEVVSDALGLPKGRLEIVTGLKSRLKRIEVAGLELAEIRERLSRRASGKAGA